MTDQEQWQSLAGPPPTNPAISVVMPVHNALPYLNEAIQSILDQSWQDFELVIGDDNSSDGSFEHVQEFARGDIRIRIARSKVRLGPVGSSNWVAHAARAPMVARMDADDVARHDRLERQKAVLDATPEAVMVGSLNDIINAHSRVIREVDRALLGRLSVPPIAHSSIFYRKAVFDRIGGYDPDADYAEDHDLYARMTRQGAVMVITDPLISYRVAGSSARQTDDPQVVESHINRAVRRMRGYEPEPNAKLDPVVIRVLGWLRLWSGQSMTFLVPMLSRMKVRPLRESLHTVVWLALCVLSPGLVRALVRARVKWRNWRVRDCYRAGHVYKWQAEGQLIDHGALMSYRTQYER